MEASEKPYRRDGLLDLLVDLAEDARLLWIIPLAAGFLTLIVCFIVSPIYTATARILPPSQQQNASAAFAAQVGGLAALVGGSSAFKNPVDQYASLLRT